MCAHKISVQLVCFQIDRVEVINDGEKRQSLYCSGKRLVIFLEEKQLCLFKVLKTTHMAAQLFISTEDSRCVVLL